MLADDDNRDGATAGALDAITPDRAGFAAVPCCSAGTLDTTRFVRCRGVLIATTRLGASTRGGAWRAINGTRAGTAGTVPVRLLGVYARPALSRTGAGTLARTGDGTACWGT